MSAAKKINLNQKKNYITNFNMTQIMINDREASIPQLDILIAKSFN